MQKERLVDLCKKVECPCFNNNTCLLNRLENGDCIFLEMLSEEGLVYENNT